MGRRETVSYTHLDVYKRQAAASPRPWWSLAACLVSYFLFWLDMSGYADIAIAMGGFMGLKVPENFKKPLKAASMTQFWRNWHVSLTDWIRCLLYTSRCV